MRVIFLGSGAFGGETLKWLVDSEHEILEVLTQPARPAGRGRKILPTPIAQLAATCGLPYHEIANINDTETISHLQQLQPEIILIIAFGQWIGTKLLNLPECYVINLHSSLLPKYRGAAPINWAIINGDNQTGLTVIKLNEVWDGGDIFGQSITNIRPGETAGELHDRLARMGPDLVAQVLRDISQGTVTTLHQDESLATKAPKLSKSDGALHWRHPAEQIRNQIHGMWPWPGAYCYLQQKNNQKQERLSLARAERVTGTGVLSSQTPQPGEILEDFSIQCGRDRLRLLQVKPENGKFMDFLSFLNGRRLRPGDRFNDG